MMGRHRNLMDIGFVVFLAAWFAWKVLVSKSKVPTPAPATQSTDR